MTQAEREYFNQFIKDRYDEGLSVKEIAAQVPYSIEYVASTIEIKEQTAITEKAKSDIVYFSESVLGFALQEWQKDVLRKYEQGEIVWFGSHRSGRDIVKEVIREHRKLCHIPKKKYN